MYALRISLEGIEIFAKVFEAHLSASVLDDVDMGA